MHGMEVRRPIINTFVVVGRTKIATAIRATTWSLVIPYPENQIPLASAKSVKLLRKTRKHIAMLQSRLVVQVQLAGIVGIGLNGMALPLALYGLGDCDEKHLQKIVDPPAINWHLRM